MDLGHPLKRHTIIPLKEPVRAPEPAAPPLPDRREAPAVQPERVPERVG